MARLSVNLNKIALLRNARTTGVPDVLRFAALAREAGAAGLTVHPRPDERHIRRTDVLALAEWMRPWRPALELNVEGYPDEQFMALVEQVRPEQCTLVPDSPGVLTSDEGWRLDAGQRAVVAAAMPRLRAAGCRVILFVDPDATAVPAARDAGAQGVEIYTGGFARAFREGAHAGILASCAGVALAAEAAGMVVNVGHDLNLHNIPPLLRAVPGIAEASIGHELTADALETGFSAAVARYVAALSA